MAESDGDLGLIEGLHLSLARICLWAGRNRETTGSGMSSRIEFRGISIRGVWWERRRCPRAVWWKEKALRSMWLLVGMLLAGRTGRRAGARRQAVRLKREIAWFQLRQSRLRQRKWRKEERSDLERLTRPSDVCPEGNRSGQILIQQQCDRKPREPPERAAGLGERLPAGTHWLVCGGGTNPSGGLNWLKCGFFQVARFRGKPRSFCDATSNGCIHCQPAGPTLAAAATTHTPRL